MFGTLRKFLQGDWPASTWFAALIIIPTGLIVFNVPYGDTKHEQGIVTSISAAPVKVMPWQSYAVVKLDSGRVVAAYEQHFAMLPKVGTRVAVSIKPYAFVGEQIYLAPDREAQRP